VQLYEVRQEISFMKIIETSKSLFLIMEYASGGELFDYIVERKRLKESDACKYY
jgi:serine/threonine protein kinase